MNYIKRYKLHWNDVMDNFISYKMQHFQYKKKKLLEIEREHINNKLLQLVKTRATSGIFPNLENIYIYISEMVKG